MKKSAILFVSALCVLSACQNAITDTIGTTSGRKWTFIVYMAAENDLEPAAINDFNELEGIRLSGKAVSILVLFDRIAGYDATNGNWDDTRLYEITSDPNGVDATIVSRRLDCLELGLSAANETELDMSGSLVLSRLITYAKRVYTAENYGLIIWGHGTGWRGGGVIDNPPEPLKAIAFDDSTGHYMTLPSLGEAVAGKGLSVICFDTCFAALLEIAYQLRNDAEWLVGSEGVIPSNGWDYTSVFTSFLQNQNLSVNNFCNAAITQFGLQYGGVTGATISGIKLSEVNNLYNTFETFSETIALSITDTASRDNVLNDVLNTVESYYFTSFPSDLYIDIYDFSQRMVAIRNTITSDAGKRNDIYNAGNTLQNALQNAVPLSWAKNGTTRKLGVHVIPLLGASVPRATHEGEYIRGSMYPGKSAFVENSNHWAPNNIPNAGSFLDKLFYFF
jgi:hypothetical protein